MKIGYSNIDFWSFLEKENNLLKETLFFDKILIQHGSLKMTEKLLTFLPDGKKLFSDRMNHLENLEQLRLKYDVSKIETICISTAEIIENLATLKLSKAVKTIFDITKGEIDLLDFERKLKGRETSYLFYLNEKFKNHSNNGRA